MKTFKGEYNKIGKEMYWANVQMISYFTWKCETQQLTFIKSKRSLVRNFKTNEGRIGRRYIWFWCCLPHSTTMEEYVEGWKSFFIQLQIVIMGHLQKTFWWTHWYKLKDTHQSAVSELFIIAKFIKIRSGPLWASRVCKKPALDWRFTNTNFEHKEI